LTGGLPALTATSGAFISTTNLLFILTGRAVRLNEVPPVG
jgi:hypothetical protein